MFTFALDGEKSV